MSCSRTTPLIIGHRGAASVAPENTLTSFELALRAGADGIEFDVRLSADDMPVVIHDATLKRTGSRRERVSSLTMGELAQVDAGSWFNRRFPPRGREEYARQRIPSLAQLFAAVKDSRARLYLELKSDRKANPKLAARVVDLIRAHNYQDRVIIESFKLENLQIVKRIDPALHTAALFEPALKPISLLRSSHLIKRALAIEADEIALHHSAVNQRTVSAAHEAGLAVVVWTLDAPSWIRRAQRLGIKAVITNRPAEMLRARDASD